MVGLQPHVVGSSRPHPQAQLLCWQARQVHTQQQISTGQLLGARHLRCNFVAAQCLADWTRYHDISVIDSDVR